VALTNSCVPAELASREISVRAGHSTRKPAPTNVLQLSYRLKMHRIDARSISADVVYLHVGLNCAESFYVDDSMHALIFAVNMHVSVAVIADLPLPHPAACSGARCLVENPLHKRLLAKMVRPESV
jgi:hypothetical protein